MLLVLSLLLFVCAVVDVVVIAAAAAVVVVVVVGSIVPCIIIILYHCRGHFGLPIPLATTRVPPTREASMFRPFEFSDTFDVTKVRSTLVEVHLGIDYSYSKYKSRTSDMLSFYIMI
jgi:hypothetical protein